MPATTSRRDRDALRDGADRGRAKIAAFFSTFSQKINGWVAVEAFGTREFFAGNYLLRAAGAMAGWGGNDIVEAFYPIAREDADGEPLSGDRSYRLRFDTPPPARAF